MAVYVISDPHFGHNSMVKKYSRQHFSSVEEHDQVILDNILTTCGKRDSLYILGDVVISNDSMYCLEAIYNKVEFLHIVLGNHDNERKKTPTVRDYLTVCHNVYGMKKYKRSWLTHAPMHPDELRGKINIHGHVHDSSIRVDGENSVLDERYANVSCENTNYKPINIADIFDGWRTSL